MADLVSTHSLLAEGDSLHSSFLLILLRVSTHSLLAEGDEIREENRAKRAEVSTHSLLAEGDLTSNHQPSPARVFQPTPSSRRETALHSTSSR